MPVLNDIVISSCFGYSMKKEFNRFTHHVTGLYIRGLKKIKTSNISKVIISVYDKDAFSANEELLINVLRIPVKIDFDKYWEMDKNEKRYFLLNLMQKKCLELAERFGWNKQIFIDAYNYVIEKNFKIEEYWSKHKYHPNRKVKAMIFYTYDDECSKLYLVIKNRKGEELKKVHFATLPAHDYFIYHALGRLEWIEENKVKLISRLENQEWTVEI